LYVPAQLLCASGIIANGKKLHWKTTLGDIALEEVIFKTPEG